MEVFGCRIYKAAWRALESAWRAYWSPCIRMNLRSRWRHLANDKTSNVAERRATVQGHVSLQDPSARARSLRVTES